MFLLFEIFFQKQLCDVHTMISEKVSSVKISILVLGLTFYLIS